MTDLFAIVNVQTIKSVLNEGSLSSQIYFIRGSSIHLTDGPSLTAHVSMAKEGEGHLLSVTGLQCPIQWQDIKDLETKKNRWFKKLNKNE